MRLILSWINTKTLLFALSGGLQYLFDIGIFSLATLLGVNVQLANISSRFLAAGFGFGFNGWIVFGHLKTSDKRQVLYSGAKFCALLGVMTLLSTVLITLGIYCFGQSTKSILTIKIVIELLLGFLSFLAQQQLIFRKKSVSNY